MDNGRLPRLSIKTIVGTQARQLDLSQVAPRDYASGAQPEGSFMAKAISLFLLAVMLVQIVYPLGLPGLRKRGDFWKVAVAAIGVMMLTVLLRPH